MGHLPGQHTDQSVWHRHIRNETNKCKFRNWWFRRHMLSLGRLGIWSHRLLLCRHRPQDFLLHQNLPFLSKTFLNFKIVSKNWFVILFSVLRKCKSSSIIEVVKFIIFNLFLNSYWLEYLKIIIGWKKNTLISKNLYFKKKDFEMFQTFLP